MTNGPWSVLEKDFTNSGAGDEGLPEPNATGDKLVIGLPKAGLVEPGVHEGISRALTGSPA